MSHQLDLAVQNIEVFRKRKLTDEERSFLVKIDPWGSWNRVV